MNSRTSDRFSILIVSSSEQFNMLVEKALPERTFNVIEIRKSASSARRELLVRDYDMIQDLYIKKLSAGYNPFGHITVFP